MRKPLRRWYRKARNFPATFPALGKCGKMEIFTFSACISLGMWYNDRMKNNKTWKNDQFIISLIGLGIFLPPCIYNWFYIPMIWGKVTEFWQHVSSVLF